MRILGVIARVDGGSPRLEFRNEGAEPVAVTLVALQPIPALMPSDLISRRALDYGRGNHPMSVNDGGAGPCLMFHPRLEIPAGESWQSTQDRQGFNSNPQAASASEWLEQGLALVVPPGDERVVRIHVDLDPQQREQDQVAPSFFVIRRAENGGFTEFFSIMGSLQGQPSLLESLLESRRHGA